MSTPNEFNFEIKKLVNNLTNFTREQSASILDDKKCYSSLLLIGKILNSNSIYIDFGIFAQTRFDQVIANYLREILKERTSVDFQTKLDWQHAETALERNEILAQTFTYAIDITNEIVQCSVEFCTLFVEYDGLRLCLEFLKDQDFLNKNENVKILFGRPVGITDFLTMIIANLANRTCDEQKHLWKSFNAAEILLKIANVNINAHYTLVYLIDDKEIESLFEQNKMKPILEALLRLLIEASIKFKENDFQRLYIQLSFKGRTLKYDIHHVNRDDGVLTSLGGVLVRLYKLAVNDLIKLAIYFDQNIKDCLKAFLEKGN
jgi:predicted transcriptional regulator